MAAASDVVALPERVEEQLRLICAEKLVSEADVAARKRLLEIGEQESLNLLRTIRNSTSVWNLSGFITHLYNNRSRNCSPSAPLTNSPPTPQVPGNTSNENKRKRSSECSARRKCCFGSPTSVVLELSPLKSYSDHACDELAKLDYQKTFMILNYLGRYKLEDVLSVEKIQSYQRLTMATFEIEIWNEFGRRDNSHENERVKVTNWETGERNIYHCHVDAEGRYSFKGPYRSKDLTPLQMIVGDEHVLIVKFLEPELMHNSVFNKVFDEGIFVGTKHFRFFVFKVSGKVDKKKDPTSSPVTCYFVCTEGFASILGVDPHHLKNMPIQEARKIFMHIHTISNPSTYMARLSLILSKGILLDMNFNDVRVEILDDIPCLNEDGDIIEDIDGKALILTDGTGFISEDLALRCPHNIFKGRINSEENIQDLQGSAETLGYLNNSESSELKLLPPAAPLLIQFRLFHKGRAIKGTVLVNKKLPPNTIQVRRSMVKVDRDESLSDAITVNAFFVVTTSNKPKVARLSKNLIALLHYGGVPRTFFMSMLSDAVEKQLSVLYRTKAALKVAVNWDSSDGLIDAKMVGSGIPLDEPYLRHRLLHIVKEEMKSPKAGKVAVDDCFYLMGTVDPTGTLNSNEVCIIMDQGQISGQVLVYRNPGTHPGDIHVVQAVYVKALEDFVGDSKYGIFFPSKGPRSMADEIAGGDYDGDLYWFSRNPELLKHFKQSEPWRSSTSQEANKKLSLLSGIALESEPLSDIAFESALFRLYRNTRLFPSNAMGKAADSWLVYMDRLLTLKDDCASEKAALMKKIYKLIDIYYDALDAPKKGKKVKVPHELIPEMYPHHMGRGEHCTYYSKSILGEIHDTVDQLFNYPIKFWKLECFKVEIPDVYRNLWRDHYDTYRKDMSKALNESRNTDAVYQKYRKELYGGVDKLKHSEKANKVIQLEAMAIYHVCYDYAYSVSDLGKCGFAWKVAGDVLVMIYLESKGETPLLFSPSIVRTMMR